MTASEYYKVLRVVLLNLENTITPPRKPNNIPRPTIRVGLPQENKVQRWISHNHLLDLDQDLAMDAARIFQSAPTWLRRCGIHTKLDPVLGRCSWEENSSVCIRFRQTHRTLTQQIDRTTMRVGTCAMINKLQRICWPDNEEFKIEDVEVVGFYANNTTQLQRLEGMITIGYRRHIPIYIYIYIYIYICIKWLLILSSTNQDIAYRMIHSYHTSARV